MTVPDLDVDALDYPFDPVHVATAPAHPRDAARLMVVDRASGEVSHASVRDIGRWLGPGDALVVNRTAVLRARLIADDTEGLLLEPMPDGSWRMLLRKAKRFRPGERLCLRRPGGAPGTGADDDRGVPGTDAVELIERSGEAWRVWLLAGDEGGGPDAVLERSGWTPLPPYILRSRVDRGEHVGDAVDREEYETVYADAAQRASVAAPTAGLHFTPELLADLGRRGVQRAELVLHVGAGTFKPVDAPTLSAHPMHRERFHVPAATAALLRSSPRPRLVAVGTTTVRALESMPDPVPAEGHSADTGILISPGHRFRHVDAMITNFHLPRSTLLALVGAFVGLDRLKELYALAQREGYRFYSYGDAMFIR
jgi:S-adenosylmethionine:tRNA ribosyltransferase-isomerase